MASSAPKVAEREHHEAPREVAKKAKVLATIIKESKHFIVFTGAGISTSAGIPDFRGPEGVWTLRAQGKAAGGANTLQAIPTPTHMALVQLQNQGLLKYVISQNCDGLHRRSGISPEKISELHGNNNREYCKECGKEYMRDFRAVAKYEKTVHDHRTGRKCVLCGGALLDTIINFHEPLPEVPLQLAYDHAAKADLCLVLGSSLTVTPSNEIPEVAGRAKEADLVICNLQKTPMDELCKLRVHSDVDSLMLQIMENLKLSIPPFILRRRLHIKITSSSDSWHEIGVSGVDTDATPVSFLKSVKLENNRRTIRSEPFNIQFRGDLELGTGFNLELEFMGHYAEPNLHLTHEYNSMQDKDASYALEYNPETGSWDTSQIESMDT